MPFAPGTFDKKKADEEDEGLLGKIGGFLQDPLGNAGGDSTAAKNARGAAKFLNPINLTPAIVGGLVGGGVDTALEAARAVPSAAAALGAFGTDVKALDESPLSFLTNTEYIKNNAKDIPLAEKLSANIHEASPLLGGVAEGVAQTGTRLMAEGASQATRTGLFGPQRTSRELLAGRNAQGLTYGEQAEQGSLFPAVVQDLLTVAPGLRGVAGGLEKAGAEGAASGLARAANAAERAPLAPYAVPAKGIYNAIGKAAEGDVAFPHLSGLAERPLAGILPRAAENIAQGTGGIFKATEIRGNVLGEQAQLMRGQKPAMEALRDTTQALTDTESQALGIARSIDEGSLARFEEQAKAGQPLPENLGTPEAVSMARKYLAGDKEAVAKLGPAVDALNRIDETANPKAVISSGPTIDPAALKGDIASLKARLEGMTHEPATPGNLAERLAHTGKLTEAEAALASAKGTLPEQGSILTPGQQSLSFEAGAANGDAVAAAQQLVDELKASTPQKVLPTPGNASERLGLESEISAKKSSLEGRAPVQSEFFERETPSTFSPEGDYTGGHQVSKALHSLDSKVLKEAKQYAIEKLGKADAAKGLSPVTKDGLPWKEGMAEQPIFIRKEALDSAMKGVGSKNIDNFAVDMFDAVTGAWKTGVLPLNPAWQMGNIVSNAVTAMTHGGVSPEWWFKNRKRIAEQIKDPSEGGAGVMGSGGSAEFANVRQAKTKAGQFFRDKITDPAYKLNEYVDNQSHMAVFLSELDKAQASGLTGRAAVDAAESRSLQVMGNFKNMSGLERDVIRRAIPFYTWSKHSTKMSLREAMNNPVRQLRLATVANKLQGDSPEGLDFLEGAIPMGNSGQFLRVPGGGGQLGLGGVEESPLTNPVAAIGALNPLLTSPLVLAGFNPRAGRRLTTGPSQDVASQAAGYGINQIPLTKALADLYEGSPLGRGENVVKGDTRAPLLVNRRPILETKQGVGPIPAPLLRFLTGTMIDEPDTRGAAKRQTLAEKAAKKDVNKAEKDSQRSAR